jgi:hypothetical protein
MNGARNNPAPRDPRDEARALAEASPRSWVVCFADDCLPFRKDAATGKIQPFMGEIYAASGARAREIAKSLGKILGQDVCAMPVRPWACKRVEAINALERPKRRKRRSDQAELF